MKAPPKKKRKGPTFAKKRLYPGDLLQYKDEPNGFYVIINYFKKLSDTYDSQYAYCYEQDKRCYEVIFLNQNWVNEHMLESQDHVVRQFLFPPCHILEYSKLILRLNDNK